MSVRSFRPGDKHLALRVQTENAGTEHQGMGTIVWISRQTINHLGVANQPGAAVGYIWQRPCLGGFN
jgi:hypothetical protein